METNVKREADNDPSKYAEIEKRFKCPKCTARGLTLVETMNGFTCTNCGTKRGFGFWYKPFLKAPDMMTFRVASQVIGANPTGSTLRRAQIEGRLKTSGRVLRKSGKKSKRDYLISKHDLIMFYLTKYLRRPKRKEISKNGKQTSQSKS